MNLNIKNIGYSHAVLLSIYYVHEVNIIFFCDFTHKKKCSKRQMHIIRFQLSLIAFNIIIEIGLNLFSFMFSWDHTHFLDIFFWQSQEIFIMYIKFDCITTSKYAKNETKKFNSKSLLISPFIFLIKRIDAALLAMLTMNEISKLNRFFCCIFRELLVFCSRQHSKFNVLNSHSQNFHWWRLYNDE